MNTIKYQEKQMAKVQTYILKGSMVWKLIFSVFCLLCVRVYADNTYFKPIPHYFKNTEIKDIIITQQCKDIALSPQQIKDFFTLATKVPAFYRGSYMVENCYIQGFMRLNGRKVAFTIDSLGLAWLQDDIKPRAIYPCEDKRCPIRAEKDDGV